MDRIGLKTGRRVQRLLIVAVDHIVALGVHLLLEQRVLVGKLGLLVGIGKSTLGALA